MDLVVDGVAVEQGELDSLVPEVAAALQGGVRIIQVDRASGGKAVLLLNGCSSLRFEGGADQVAAAFRLLTLGPDVR